MPLTALASGVLLSSFQPTLHDVYNCLSSAYYGSYHSLGATNLTSVYMPDTQCLQELGFVASAQLNRGERLVWLEERDVAPHLKDSKMRFSELLEGFVRSLSPSEIPTSNQLVLTPSTAAILHQSQTTALISVSQARADTIDLHLPPFWRSSLLPLHPFSSASAPSSVPPSAIARINSILSSVTSEHRNNSVVAAVKDVINGLSLAQMYNDIEYLTGEDGLSGIESRHSFADGSRTAATWLKARFEAAGATCELRWFLVGFAPNVIWQVLHRTLPPPSHFQTADTRP